ncbi:MAG: hypothetical protein JO113_01850, partial [Candidatus Eremiobacteraeota bacterium]|nr:hypothetical protein [Candidatus Eremiobacteraeota bacterium]
MRLPRFSITAALALLAAGCTSTSTTTLPLGVSGLHGVVQSGTHTVAGATVTLYAMGTSGSGKGAIALGRATTNAAGKFFIAYGNGHLAGKAYAIATGGNAGKGGNAAIGLSALVSTTADAASSVTINERSTVALAFALAQFTDE